jgi:mono/diheme cytochrome c family protein
MSEVNEAIKGCDEAEKQLDNVASWVFTHPDVWDEMNAEDIRDLIETIKADIDDVKQILKESAQK